MVGKRLFLYTKGDVTRIRNYHEAIRDTKTRYSVFHLNLLTQMGVMDWTVLERIGKWYDCEPEELILLPKAVWKELCAKVGKATKHGHFG